MSIFKEWTEVWNCLFNHQPFLQNEIHSFVKEFEEKRSDREVDKLLDTLHILCEIKDIHCDKYYPTHEANLTELSRNIQQNLDCANSVLEESQNPTKISTLEAGRKFRELDFESFKADLDSKYSKLNDRFEREISNLKSQYQEREKKLLLK